MINKVISIDSVNNNDQFNSAEVTEINSEGYQIKIEKNHYQAKKAFSCMMEPEVGDVVQIIFLNYNIFILNILERKNPNFGQINLPEDITLYSSGKISLLAKEISQHVSEYELISEKTTLISKTMNILSHHIQQLSDYNQIKTKQLIKEVAEFEQAVTKELRMIVQDHWRVDSKSAHILTEDDTTIDARTISLG